MSEMKHLALSQILVNSEKVIMCNYRSVAHFDLFQVLEIAPLQKTALSPVDTERKTGIVLAFGFLGP